MLISTECFREKKPALQNLRKTKQQVLQIIAKENDFPSANSQRKTCDKELVVRIGLTFLLLFLSRKKVKKKLK
jgi:hypothetical protein